RGKFLTERRPRVKSTKHTPAADNGQRRVPFPSADAEQGDALEVEGADTSFDPVAFEREPSAQGKKAAIEADPELTREIHPGVAGEFTIEAEDIDDFDEEIDGEEAPGKIKLRKPRPREFIVLDPDRVVPVRLLAHKPDGEDSPKEEFYYVTKPLRKGIDDSL